MRNSIEFVADNLLNLWQSAQHRHAPFPIVTIERAKHSAAPAAQRRRPNWIKTMPTDTDESRTRVTVEHFLAGLAVWAVLMAVYAIF